MEWARRKVAKAYGISPWSLDGVPEVEVYREAELLDLEDELRRPASD